jgi:hypothetical protein
MTSFLAYEPTFRNYSLDLDSLAFVVGAGFDSTAAFLSAGFFSSAGLLSAAFSSELLEA